MKIKFVLLALLAAIAFCFNACDAHKNPLAENPIKVAPEEDLPMVASDSSLEVTEYSKIETETLDQVNKLYEEAVTLTADQKRENILAAAKSYLHVRENTGNNDHPEIDKFLSDMGFKKAPYCAAYVYQSYKDANVPIIKTALAAHMAQSDKVFYKRNPSYRGIDRAEPADLYFFWSNSQRRINHVGMYEKQPLGDRSPWIYGIEGNTSVRGENGSQGVSFKVRTKAMVYKSADWVTNKTII